MTQQHPLGEILQRVQAKLDTLSHGVTVPPDDTVEIEALLAKGEALATRMGRLDSVAEVTRSLGIGASGAGGDMPTGSVDRLGDYALTMGRAKLGALGHEKYRNDAAILQRVVAHGVAADGTAPVTIEGDLVSFIDSNRYAVNRSRRLPMPDNHAPTFKRPRLTQTTTVGLQTTEGDVLSSQRLQVTGDTLTKKTYGGVLSVSEQEIDFTEPAMLGLAIQDLTEQYAITTDNVFTDALEAAFTASTQTVCSLTATADVFLKALATSAAATYASSKKVPDTFFCAVDRWAYLIGLTDGDGRPIFPTANAVNPIGTSSGANSFEGLSIAGLQVVVDPNLTTGVWGTAVSQLCESYETYKGLLTIQAPSTLETQFAVRGYFVPNIYSNGVNAIETS